MGFLSGGISLLDECALLALEARLEQVEESQVNKLIELLEFTKNLDIIKVFIARQVGRRQWTRRPYSYSAARLYKILRQCDSLEKAREVLGLFKWFFEAGGRNISALNRLRSKYGSLVFNPSKDAPEGFADEYLRAVLGL